MYISAVTLLSWFSNDFALYLVLYVVEKIVNSLVCICESVCKCERRHHIFHNSIYILNFSNISEKVPSADNTIVNAALEKSMFLVCLTPKFWSMSEST